MNKNKRVVIVGAGFAGLSALLVLIKKKVDAKITLIDKNDYFEYIPSLHLCIKNESKIDKIRISLKKYYGEYFVKANVLSITSKKVTTDVEDFDFDYLIIASGSVTNTFKNKSFEKNTLFAKKVFDIIKINEKIDDAKQISVIGGGYAGVEIAAILALRTKKNIHLFDEEETLLRGSNEQAKKVAFDALDKLGIKMHLGKRCLKCSKTHVFLPGKKIGSDIHILTAGIKCNDSFFKFGDVKKTLQTTKNKNVFICGDVARSGLLPTAHNAMVSGRVAGYNVSLLLNNKNNLIEVTKKKDVLAIALGESFGVIPIKENAYTSHFTSFLKWLIEKRIMFEFKRKILLPL